MMVFGVRHGFSVLRQPSIARRSSSCAVGAGRADDAARLAALAAFVESALSCFLDVVARYNRPTCGRKRKGAARGAKEADFRKALRRSALRSGSRHGVLA